MAAYSDEIAKRALKIGQIELNPQKPFLWASGYFMPIYNDNRLILFDPDYRKFISGCFESLIKENKLPCEVIAGTSTAGIYPGTSLADRMNLPFIYVREKPKDHGLKNRIEGIRYDSDLGGRATLLVEDLISTGGSSVSAMQAIREANGSIKSVLAIFNYGLEEAVKRFSDADCWVHSLLDYVTLLKVAKEKGYIDQDEVKLLEEWRQDPFGWGEKNGFPRKLKS